MDAAGAAAPAVAALSFLPVTMMCDAAQLSPGRLFFSTPCPRLCYVDLLDS